MEKGGLSCFWVRHTGIRPFRRCAYCEKNVQDCFGMQFFVIALGIICLLLVMFTIRDLPIMAIEITLVISLLIGLLSLIANNETNEIVMGNYLLKEMNELLDKKVNERTAELKILNAELNKAVRIKSNFLTNISHELRTPITAILGFSDILKGKTIGPLTEHQEKFIDSIGRNGNGLLFQINSLIELAKLEANKMVLNKRDIDLSKIISEITASLEPLAMKKNIAIAVNCGENARYVFADEDRIRQVIINLLDNAVKFTGIGGKIDISASDMGDKVSVSVSDNGIGISKENIGVIFEKFKQLDSPIVRKYPGSGIGLSIVKSLVEEHGGTVLVESEPDKGTRFTFYLPKKPK